MKLIVITPDWVTPGEPELINRMFDAGMPCLHLRKPGLTLREYSNVIAAIQECHHQRIIICGHFELLKAHNLGGIHLNSHQRLASDWEQSLSLTVNQSISTSFHSWQELRENTYPFHYVFISPVFDSISKQGYLAAIDLAGAEAVKREFLSAGRYCPEIIGLGGVSPANIAPLCKNGFDGAAALGAVWQSASPEQTVNELSKAISAFPC